MTSEELRALIASDATGESSAKALADAGNWSGCAARCMEIAPKIPRPGTLIGELGILALFSNPVDGETVLQKLEAVAGSNPVVARAVKWIQPNAPGIDLGHPSTRAMLDFLASEQVPEQVRLTTGTVESPGEYDTLKAAGEQSQTITERECSDAFAAEILAAALERAGGA